MIPKSGHRFSEKIMRRAKLMRFIFKTDYAQDIRLFQHGGQVFWYGAARRAAARRAVSGQRLRALAASFHLIYAIVGFGLMLLVGYTGQISLGHAAFLAIGAYTEALLQARRHAVRRLARQRGAVLRRGRHHRRAAGAAAEGHLSRDRDLRVQRHRRGDHHALGASSPAATAASCSRRSKFSATG